MDNITIDDDVSEPVFLTKGSTYQLIRLGKELFGSFTISGVPAVETAYTPGAVYLADVPLTGQKLLVDVNHRATALMKIENKGSEGIGGFAILHPDIASDDQVFGSHHYEITEPKPFTAVWTYYDPYVEGRVQVTVSIKPLPREHAIEISFTTSE